MGYFPNGTSGAAYEAEYCDRCVHQDADGEGCAVWLAHLMYSYRDCNDENSILHLLIPQTKDGLGNEECKLFVEVAECSDPTELEIATEHLKRNQKAEALLHLGRALGGNWKWAFS